MQGKEVCSFFNSAKEQNFVFTFAYKEKEHLELKINQDVTCNLFAIKGIPQIRVNNEDYARVTNDGEVRNIQPKEEKTYDGNGIYSLNGGYGYDISAADPSVMDVKNNQVKTYTEESHNINGVFPSWEFELNQKNQPVLYHLREGYDEDYSSNIYTWRENEEVWEKKRNEASIKVSEKQIKSLSYNEESKKYIGLEGKNLIYFDKEGNLLHRIDIKNGKKEAELAFLKWVKKDQVLYQVSWGRYLEGKNYKAKRKTVLYDLTKKKEIRTYDLKDSFENIECIAGDKMYVTTEDQKLLVINLSSGKAEKTINFKGVKLVSNLFEKNVDSAEWISMRACYEFDVYKGRIFLLSKWGLYVWDEEKKLWELWMNGNQMPGLSFGRMYPTCFRMVSEDEFYVFAVNYDDEGATDFFHYKKVSDEPGGEFTIMTDDFNITNGIITDFVGITNKERNIVIPEKVTEIMDYAFKEHLGEPPYREGEERARLVWPSKLRINNAFEQCIPLVIEIPDGVEDFSTKEFSNIWYNFEEGTPPQKVIIPSSVKTFHIESMYSWIEWEFVGDVPKVEKSDSEQMNFAKMIVPAGMKQDYINAFGLEKEYEKRIATKT